MVEFDIYLMFKLYKLFFTVSKTKCPLSNHKVIHETQIGFSKK